MIDVVAHINEIQREVNTGQSGQGEGTSVVLRRRYDAGVDDVWDACTSPERLKRWFVPVSGELKLGGRFQLEGQAGGEILRCEPPKLLRITWVYGDQPPSEVEVRLTPRGDEETLFELEHIAIMAPGMEKYGPGAVGVGWDLGLLGLGLHLAGGTIDNPGEWEQSDEAKEFVTLSSQAWGAAYRRFGASAEEVATAVAETTAFYRGEAVPPETPQGGQ
jgi:uncharacterized protein YndB with AHSA1/START domain